MDGWARFKAPARIGGEWLQPGAVEEARTLIIAPAMHAPTAIYYASEYVLLSALHAPRCSACCAVLVRELRNEVSRLLAAKVADPSLDLGRSRVVEAMHHLLASDGF